MPVHSGAKPGCAGGALGRRSLWKSPNTQIAIWRGFWSIFALNGAPNGDLRVFIILIIALRLSAKCAIPNLMGALGRTPLCYLPQIIGRGDHHIAGLTMRNVDRVGCRIHGLCT